MGGVNRKAAALAGVAASKTASNGRHHSGKPAAAQRTHGLSAPAGAEECA
jgi:hypothetical protein